MPTINITPVVSHNGASLSAEWLDSMVELRIERQFQVPTRVTLRFSDPGYELLASSKLELGDPIEVKQYDGPKMADVEITSISAEQRTGEQPELVVIAFDRSHRLGREAKVKTYQNTKYSDIVTQLAAQAQLKAEVDSTTLTLEYVMQAESGLMLLSEIARRIGYDWWVGVEKDLHFKKPSSTGHCDLELGKDLRSFSARVSSVVPSKVQVDGWNYAQQESVTHTTSATSVPRASSPLADMASKAHTKFHDSTGVYSFSLGAQNASEAQILADAVYERAATSAVTAKGVTDGNAGIDLGVTVNIKGAGPLNGTYPVTEVEHVFRRASGFVTRFTSGERRPTSLVDTLGGGGHAVAAVPYGGPAHFRSGLTVAKVTNNNDDAKLGRVKLSFPDAAMTAQTGWARVVTVGGGSNRGSVWIPEIDDEVLVGFEGGDARQPVVIGGLFSDKKAMPEIEVDSGKVQRRAMTSRLGHAISLLDGSSKEKQGIELALAEDKGTVHVGNDKMSLTVPSGVPLEIVAGDSSIKFDANGNITMEGVNITIKARNKLDVECVNGSLQANASMDIKSQAKLGVSGAMIEVQAQGPTKVVGNPVMIN